MNLQSVKNLIESYGKLDTSPCWEIVNNNSPDKKYVWIIEQPSNIFRPENISKHINVKNEFSIHLTGTYIPHPAHAYFVSGYLASFEFRTDTLMNGVISKITLVQRKRTENYTSIETFSTESDWLNCKSGSKYCYLSNEQWEFDGNTYMIPTFTVKIPNSAEINYNLCIIVIIELINTSNIGIPPANSEEQDREHAALVMASQIYHSKDYADVALVVKRSNGENEKLMAHKAFLAAKSSVFRTMMETNMVEKKSSVIEIVDFEPEIIEEMLKFIYTGEANLVNHAEHLLRCADKYDVQELIDICQKYIAKNISTVGFAKVFEILQLYEERVPILKKSAEEYFKKNESSLGESDEFHKAAKAYPIEFVDLYNSKKRKREED